MNDDSKIIARLEGVEQRMIDMIAEQGRAKVLLERIVKAMEATAAAAPKK